VGEGDREHHINGVREGALVQDGNGVGQKCPLVNLNTRVFLSMKINRTVN
jgi:hypothetical protein